MPLISQELSLKSFIATQLSDLLIWERDIVQDARKESTRDQAHIVIKTAYNRYQLSVTSPYIDPPAGAPTTCKQLGTVEFYDPAEDKRVLEPRSDNTWIGISKHIHVREYTDMLAVAKRELAEANLGNAGSARMKLASIAERAARWLEPRVIADAKRHAEVLAEEPAPGFVSGPAIVVSEKDAKEIAEAMLQSPPGAVTWVRDAHDPDKRAPFIGADIVYVTHPGEAVGGMRELPGKVVAVYSPDRISALVTASNSEPRYLDNLVRRGSDAGNGRVHQSNCWDFNPEYLRTQHRLETLEKNELSPAKLATMASDLQRAVSDIEHALKMVDELARRCAALEQKARTSEIARPKKAKAIDADKAA